MLRRLLVVSMFAVILLLQAPSGLAQVTFIEPDPMPSGTGTISGTVLTDTGAPASAARVSVKVACHPRRNDCSYRAREVLTNAAGRFVLSGLPPNALDLTAEAPDFVTAWYGDAGPGLRGTPIRLKPAQRLNVVIRLRRGASFAGTVFGADGRPASNIEVFAFRLEPMGGGQHGMLGGGRGVTNEQGNYEIEALPPGRYLLGGYRVRELTLLQLPLEVLPSGENALESGAFYPDAESWDSAETLVLAPRQARGGMNLRLHMNTVTTITGVVRGPDGRPSAGAGVRLQKPQQPDWSVSDAIAGHDGTFELTRVIAGSYEVFAYSQTGNSDPIAYRQSGVPNWGLVPVRSDGRTSSRVTVDLQPGATIAGRVQFDGVAPTLGPYQKHVFLNYVMGGNPWGITQTDEWPNFSIRGVRPGRYGLSVSVHGVVPAWRMRSAMIGGIDALDFPFEIAGTERRDVVVTMTQRHSDLSGRVRDAAGRAHTACSIVVFARDQRYWTANSRRVDVVRPDTNGYYILHDLPAGDYFVAMGAADIYGMPEPPVLTELSRGATRVTLEDSGKTVVDLKVRARPRLN